MVWHGPVTLSLKWYVRLFCVAAHANCARAEVPIAVWRARCHGIVCLSSTQNGMFW